MGIYKMGIDKEDKVLVAICLVSARQHWRGLRSVGAEQIDGYAVCLRFLLTKVQLERGVQRG